MTRFSINVKATVESDLDEEKIWEAVNFELQGLADDNGATLDEITVKEAVSA
jgi:hypothetical protein